MLLKRSGSTTHTVVTDFKAEALNEISFARDGAFSLPTERFGELYTRIREEALTALADGPVQKDAEEALLEELDDQIEGLRGRLGEGEILLIENDTGVDWPKTRERRQDVIREGENRFHFHWRVDPPLRLGVYRREA
ncbi:MAG: hypothetical protein EA351_09095 [Gemmatimonadales bacterium]|nr:MAG: hypothetical protein EA351_09095 [Gemmatimonadales bacterium]